MEKSISIGRSWSSFISAKTNKFYLTATLFLAVIAVTSGTATLYVVEDREGISIPDPLIYIFPAMDLSYPTFAIIYVLIITSFSYCIRMPARLLMLINTYAIILLFRNTTLLLVPLAPPEGIITLVDPIVGNFTGSPGGYNNDLFYSGHTAFAITGYFFYRHLKMRGAVVILCVAVVVMILLQRVHYTIDVIAAVPFAYLSYRLAVLLNRFFTPTLTTPG